MDKEVTADALRAQVEAARRDAALLRDSAREMPEVKPLPPLNWGALPGRLVATVFLWWLVCVAIFIVTWILYAATGQDFRDGAGAAAILVPAYGVAAIVLLARVVRAVKRRAL
jgi:hypothetical protein